MSAHGCVEQCPQCMRGCIMCHPCLSTCSRVRVWPTEAPPKPSSPTTQVADPIDEIIKDTISTVLGWDPKDTNRLANKKIVQARQAIKGSLLFQLRKEAVEYHLDPEAYLSDEPKIVSAVPLTKIEELIGGGK